MAEIEIKLETRSGATLRKRWLKSLPKWARLGSDAALTLKGNNREVLIVGFHAAVSDLPDEHQVVFRDGAREHWVDIGPSLQEALAFAQTVLRRGAAAFDQV